ncbi:MAG: NAD(P)/FAD-dependent oxidoreductase [Bauldia sp.]|nr:NAD(P)/FAD-dependent oxidoreductase [Bauldia sp.]
MTEKIESTIAGFPVRRVAIIGAGWSGLQIADVLVGCGYEVVLFEALDDVGGTWHPATAYAGLAIHTPVFRAAFHGFPYPPGTDPLGRVEAADIFAYCRAFAGERGLLPRIRFRHRVASVAYDSAGKRSTITALDEATGGTVVEVVDFVVSTQFNAPRMPRFPRDGFAGEVLHSNAVKPETLDRVVAEGRRVVLLGAGKAGTDLALELSRRGIAFRWVMRKMYWFMAFDRIIFDTRRGRRARFLPRLAYLLGLSYARTPRRTERVFRLWRALGLAKIPGAAHDDVTKFHHGWLDDGQMARIAALPRTIGEVARLGPEGVVLADGQAIPCDVLICATGCDPIATPIALSVDGRAVRYEDVGPVYRHSVIPALPRLCFTGYWQFGFGPLNGYHRAAWIMRHIERDLGEAELRALAEREGGRPVFRDGGILFDGRENIIPATFRTNDAMMEGLYSHRDLRRYFIRVVLRYVFRPYGGVERFITARRKRAAPVRPTAGEDR